jgi:hypothetical protein
MILVLLVAGTYCTKIEPFQWNIVSPTNGSDYIYIYIYIYTLIINKGRPVSIFFSSNKFLYEEDRGPNFPF